jgi:hypothetical protein
MLIRELSVPAFLKMNDPEKYIKAPKPAKKSTKIPLLFAWKVRSNDSPD